jgi:hypothetical protein
VETYIKMQRDLKKYYDPRADVGFSSKTALVKKFGKKYAPEDIIKWTQSQPTITKFAPWRRTFRRRPTIAHRKMDIIAMDLADMSRHAKHNRNIRYFAVLIDTLSR